MKIRTGRVLLWVVGFLLAEQTLRAGYYYDVSVTGANAGNVWGTDIYRADSDIAKAAVHAGLLTIGQTKTIRVRDRGSVGTFSGTSRNGITTTSWGSVHAAITLEVVTGPGGGPTQYYEDYLVQGNLTGTVYGTDTYVMAYSDNLAAAAVHQGLLTPLQTRLIRSFEKPGLGAYTGSTRNGITSLSFGSWFTSMQLELAPTSWEVADPVITATLPSQIFASQYQYLTLDFFDQNADLRTSKLYLNGSLAESRTPSGATDLIHYNYNPSSAGTVVVRVDSTDSRYVSGGVGSPGFSRFETTVQVLPANRPPHTVSANGEVINWSNNRFRLRGNATDLDGNLARMDFYVMDQSVSFDYEFAGSATISGGNTEGILDWEPSWPISPGATYYVHIRAYDIHGTPDDGFGGGVQQWFVAKAKQTLSVAPYASPYHNPPSVTVSRPVATASSGLAPYMYRYSGPAYFLAYSPYSLVMTDVGTVVVRIQQAGNDYYFPAADVDLSIVVLDGDLDGDGMANKWETANSFNYNNAADGPQDADGDGLTNVEEYRAGSKPRSAAVAAQPNEIQLKVLQP